MHYYRCRYQVRRTKGAGWTECGEEGVVCLGGDWFCTDHGKTLARAQEVLRGRL